MRFVVFGDSKGKRKGINEKVLRKILHQTCKLNPQPKFLIVCGDSIAGSSSDAEIQGQLEYFKSLVQGYHPLKTILPVVGNHEVNNLPKDDAAEKVFARNYCELTASDELIGYNQTAYCVDVDNTRLIFLNAFHFGQIHRIEKEQLEWFKEVASVKTEHKIVFVHSPAYPTGAHLGNSLDSFPIERDMFWKVVDESGVELVISGHEHNYSRRLINHSMGTQNASFNNSVYQIITGGGGEKLRDKYKDKKGVIIPPKDIHHFVVVDVESDINVQAISADGKKIDQFVI